MSWNLRRQQILKFAPKVKVIRMLTSQVKVIKNHINPNVPKSMSAWSLKDYNGLCSLELVENVEIPIIQKPKDVLVKVHATSINNLDVMITDGYGKELFENYKKLCDNFKCSNQKTFSPILGRDFAGTIIAVGEGVKNFKPGQEVMGFIPPLCLTSGSHAQYVIASSCNMQIKPSIISMEEAAAVPYASLTAWSALKYSAELCMGAKGKKVLVLGASGGVGNFAVQLLKNWGSTVVSTCSPDAIQYVSKIGSDSVVDYTSPLAQQELLNYSGFDVILDCTGRSGNFSYDLLKPWSNAKFVTLSPPVLRNIDLHGMVGGFVKNGFDLIVQNSSAIVEGKTLRWAFFVPSSSALIELCGLIRDRKFKIIIDSVFSYDKLPDAYSKMKDGHARGKIIVKIC